MIPALAVFSAELDGSAAWIVVGTALFSYIPFFLAPGFRGLDKWINGKILHYHNRSIASLDIAQWITDHEFDDEPILIVGDTPQLHILCGRISSCFYLNFNPFAVEATPDLQESLIKRVIDNPPRFVILMMNCLNWEYFETRTGMHFESRHQISYGDETFPVYERVSSREPEPGVAGRLFLPCGTIREDGHRIWNHRSGHFAYRT
jgi:hypothetical protein